MSLELANPKTTEERLTALARQADARRRALLTAPDGVSSDASGQLTSAENARLTPAVAGADAPVPRQVDRGRAAGDLRFDAGGSLNFDALTPEMFTDPQVVGREGRQDNGSSNVREASVNPNFARQPTLARTVNLTHATDADARQALTRVSGRDAQQRQVDAEAVWRASVSNGVGLTGRELGERFGMSESWGRTVIGNARKRDQDPEQ